MSSFLTNVEVSYSGFQEINPHLFVPPLLKHQGCQIAIQKASTFWSKFLYIF